MLPHKVTYTIELHKFEVGLIFYMAIIAVVLPLLVMSRHTSGTQQASAAELSYPQIISHTNVTIDPAKVKLAATNQAAGQTVWPLRGKVFTAFGVPHQPWQPTHTGMDISSAQPSGQTSITPFKEGTVLQVIRSNVGYGNHVIIDHGNGMTSLYAHLYSISVVPGQRVKPGDVVGYEGSSGTSTGTHVHFEVRQNGSPVNPRQYIANNP